MNLIEIKNRVIIFSEPEIGGVQKIELSIYIITPRPFDRFVRNFSYALYTTL